ncbi:hypothetical protein NJF44_24795 [Pseudomonas guariconensis]|uniref:hypothetical protein n=1 Tax=Pseudomonas TaxID=286 RepID=UPI001CE47FB9|nr:MULTISPECIES: hypothetical protein [Pseudomonas]MCO7635364.1 hypothetical protein [Pseudomonas sp. S 311-6]MCO7517948.1 hypothetical protein [Pseudomonas putida]MCO7563708.1 hypothetical protein [Pseudomonas mosselii]MCO7595133.1 hypothetical protein [Pseudomonas guariconensis]MCO7608452.1 hypothetical protein [Pseudomonas guariconensis]
MNITWMFSRQQNSPVNPAISDQLVSMDSRFLCLRNPWTPDSVFMGKMYTSTTVLTIILQAFLWADSHIWTRAHFNILDAALIIITPLFATPFLVYRIFLINRLSHLYFDRHTKTIIYKRNKTLLTFDWNKCVGGFLQKTEFAGSSFSINYALAIAERPEHGAINPNNALWFPSNHPSECNPLYAHEVWAYICQFMAHGPDKLPPPNEPDWWRIPLNTICLTPKQAWRHYAPWRTGEPGEMQGKKNWLLPLWLVLWPYNLLSALCWYVVCRLFKVQSPAAPI